MITVIVLLAFDFAIRAAIRSDGRNSGDYAVGALPMAIAPVRIIASKTVKRRRGIERVTGPLGLREIGLGRDA